MPGLEQPHITHCVQRRLIACCYVVYTYTYTYTYMYTYMYTLASYPGHTPPPKGWPGIHCLRIRVQIPRNLEIWILPYFIRVRLCHICLSIRKCFRVMKLQMKAAGFKACSDVFLQGSVSHRMSTTIYCWLSIVGENYGRNIRGNDRLRIPRHSRENCYT